MVSWSNRQTKITDAVENSRQSTSRFQVIRDHEQSNFGLEWLDEPDGPTERQHLLLQHLETLGCLTELPANTASSREQILLSFKGKASGAVYGILRERRTRQCSRKESRLYRQIVIVHPPGKNKWCRRSFSRRFQ